jgi:hypothetical protein
VVCATHIINRTPTHVVTGTTPYEKWYGNKPSIFYFRIFGYGAWTHAPNERLNTSASPNSCYTMVGYNETFKGYYF